MEQIEKKLQATLDITIEKLHVFYFRASHMHSS